jgi:four helix bundle protein
MFGHEKFGAYRFAIEFASLAAAIIDKLPEGQSKLADQLRRSTSSIALNIAEGSGKSSILNRKHCYVIARGEAMECAAIIDVLECMRMIDSIVAATAKGTLKSIVGILTSVIKDKERD